MENEDATEAEPTSDLDQGLRALAAQLPILKVLVSHA